MDSVPHFSKSADNNKAHILEQLRICLKSGDHVLEIASGTGQHAQYFSKEIPEIVWQPSDVDLDLYSLRKTLVENGAENLNKPIQLDVSKWPRLNNTYDAIYSANCLHIINWDYVQSYINGAGENLNPDGLLLLYGPFKYKGKFTAKSNETFNGFLEKTYPGGGIRDFEQVDRLANSAGLTFVSDTAMPANNQFLVWRKKA